MRQVYMDHSATTPVDPEVFNAMIPYYIDGFGNASSVHALGWQARQAIDQARSQVGELLGASGREIIFTSGGTEADNQAIISYLGNNPDKGKHLVTSAIEHHAVLDTCLHLAKRGYELTVLPVTPDGLVEPDILRKAMKPATALVSIMHANNEVGTIQPIKELAAIAHGGGAIFHTDAVQTVGKLPLDVKEMDVDMLSASSHKLYGPKGVGCLYVRQGIRVGNYLHGGGQERGLRSGTENVPGIVGFGTACKLAQINMPERQARLSKMGHRLQEGILSTIPC